MEVIERGPADINGGVLEGAAPPGENVSIGAPQRRVALGNASENAGARPSKVRRHNGYISAAGNLNGAPLGGALSAEERIGLSHWVVVKVGHDGIRIGLGH